MVRKTPKLAESDLQFQLLDRTESAQPCFIVFTVCIERHHPRMDQHNDRPVNEVENVGEIAGVDQPSEGVYWV